jgi:hypothetical protein
MIKSWIIWTRLKNTHCIRSWYASHPFYKFKVINDDCCLKINTSHEENINDVKCYWKECICVKPPFILLRIWGFLRYATIIGSLASLSSNNVTSSIAMLATIRHMLLWYFGILLKTVWLENRLSEDIRSLGLVNDRLMMDYMPRCCCGVQADR